MHDGSVDRSAALGRRHTIRGRWHVVRLWRRTGCHVRCLMRCGKRSIVDRSSMWLHVLDIHHVWHVSGGRCVVVWHRGRHALGRPDRATRYVEGVPRWHTAAVHIAWRHAWRSILYMHRMLRGQLWAATHHMSAINAGRLSASQSRASQHRTRAPGSFLPSGHMAARDMQQEWWGACGGVDAHGSSGDSSVD